MPYVYNPATGKNDLWQPEPVKQQFGQIGQNIRNFSTGPMGDAPRQTKTIKEQFGQIGQNIRNFSTGGAPSPSGAVIGTGPTAPSATQLAGYSPVDYRSAIDPVTGVIDYTKLVTPSNKEEGGPDIGNDIISGTLTTDGTTTGTPTTDWTQLFQQFRAAGIEAAEATRLAQQQAAQNTYASQLRTAQTTARQNQTAAQQARQQISEQSFMQQRQLTQGAQQRGLGGSGIEQLAQTQSRMQTGQNVNQLVEQEMLANEKVMNYIGSVEAEKGQKLANADAQYYDNIFKLAGNDLENAKFLDSTQYRDKVFDWQQKNAEDITANNNLNTRLDLIKIMESKDLSDAGKKAVAAMMLDGGKITDQEANDLLDQYLGTAAGDKIVKGKYDWTSALVTGGLAAIGLTIATMATGGLSIPAILLGSAIAGTIGGGVSQEIQNLQGKIAFNIPGIGEWKGTRAEAIDKSNPNSLVSRAFGDKQAFKDLQFTLEGTEVRFIYQGTTYDKFNDVQAVWLRAQGR
jgi:hypothetical protein